MADDRDAALHPQGCNVVPVLLCLLGGVFDPRPHDRNARTSSFLPAYREQRRNPRGA
jgi:hypothetical protein